MEPVEVLHAWGATSSDLTKANGVELSLALVHDNHGWMDGQVFLLSFLFQSFFQSNLLVCYLPIHDLSLCEITHRHLRICTSVCVCLRVYVCICVCVHALTF